MDDIIHLLPDSIANQIAAGEVVQRPASLVKELLENSVDAGASRIKLIVKEAGKSLVQVIDNGKGMSITDARMSFERHATSKIKQSDDLFKIKTLGFRGEALASIGAVAQVEVKTRRPDDELGSYLEIDSSEVKKQEPVVMAEGTSICVKNLFYNVPARRNFLKSNPVETRHIIDEFQRIALSYPEIELILIQNGQETYQLPASKLSMRIVQLFGKNYQNQLVPCQEETPEVSISGFIGKPEFAKKTRGEQFFFINNRFIKNPYLNHAVTKSFENLLPEGYHPFYVLFITTDPKHVDINVHPTKTEVKFDDDRLIYGVVSAATRQALASFNVTPSLDFETDVNFELISKSRQESNLSTKEEDYSRFRTFDVDKKSIENWEKLYQSASDEDKLDFDRARGELTETITLQSKAGFPEVGKRESTTSRPFLQIHQRFLIRQVTSGMVIIDLKAARERILYERYLAKTKGDQGLSQSCMFPQQIEVSAADLSLIIDIKPEIRKLGFEFEVLGKQSIVINGIPSDVSGTNEKELFEDLLEQFKNNSKELKLDTNENLARSLAKQISGKQGFYLQPEEGEAIFDQLFACIQPNYTADGLPTFVVLGLDKIEDLFK